MTMKSIGLNGIGAYPTSFKGRPLGCPPGTGLQSETIDFLLSIKSGLGMIMTSSSNLAEAYFTEFGKWIRDRKSVV